MQLFSAILFLFFLLPCAPCVIFRSLQQTDPGNQSHEGFFCLQILVDVKSATGGRGASLQMFFRVHFRPVAIPTKETRKRKEKMKRKEDWLNKYYTFQKRTGCAGGPNYSRL
jgi:hypothetical protein